MGIYVYNKVPPATTLTYKAHGSMSDTAANGGHFYSFDQILEFTTANTEIVFAMGFSASYAFPYFEIEYLPESTTIVNNITTNEYVNPPTSQMSYCSVFKNYTSIQRFLNPVGTLCILSGDWSVVTGGAVSFVYAPNSSGGSYF